MHTIYINDEQMTVSSKQLRYLQSTGAIIAFIL
jgi:hypothetical protein